MAGAKNKYWRFLSASAVFFALSSAPAWAASDTAESIKKQADLGFEAPDYKEMEKVYEALQDKNKIVAMGLISKLLARHKDNLYLLLWRGEIYNLTGSRAQAISEWERAVNIAETRHEYYQALYEKLLHAYRGGVKDASTKIPALLEKMVAHFPASSDNLLATLASEYRGRHDQAKLSAVEARQRALSHPATGAPLLALKPTFKDHLTPNNCLEILARTTAFQKFKLTMNETTALGDTGTARFIEMPPDYGQILVVNEESKNAVKLPLNELLQQLAGVRQEDHDYSKVTELGSFAIDSIPCTQYKCQWQDDSSYDLLTVARDVAINQKFARVQAHFVGSPPNNFLVLAMTRVTGGFPLPVLQTFRIRRAKFTDDYCRAAAKYHRVKSIDQLIYAENGDVKLDDVKDMLQMP